MENKKELSITLFDGEKKAEFTTNNFNPKYQIAVMDGLFKFFDIDVNFEEMIRIYHKTGKSYQEFYGDKKEVALTEVNEKIKVAKPTEFTEQYKNALTKEEEKPVFTNTKVRNGVTIYKCHYICPRCGNRGNKYVGEFEKTMNCHDCLQLMAVSTAVEDKPLEQDRFGNFFIAGEFKRTLPFEKEDEIE